MSSGKQSRAVCFAAEQTKSHLVLLPLLETTLFTVMLFLMQAQPDQLQFCFSLDLIIPMPPGPSFSFQTALNWSAPCRIKAERSSRLLLLSAAPKVRSTATGHPQHQDSQSFLSPGLKYHPNADSTDAFLLISAE